MLQPYKRKTKILTLAFLAILSLSIQAQTLQQVTNNGAITTSSIFAQAYISNSNSFPGTATVSNISALNGLRLNGTIADASHNGITYQSGGGGGAAIGFYRGGSYDSGIDFYTNALAVPGALQHRMRISYSGNVGIGTASPVAKLHVFGTPENSNGSLMILGDPDNANLRLGYHDGYSWIQSHGGRPLYINDFGNDVIISKTAGNVGIGTADTKGYKLAVAGDMIAQSVKIKSYGTWPDYVFSKSHRILSLKETASYIADHGHLPGIPSAEEVKREGIELARINASLLEKIEELTLHLIEKDKEMDKIKNQLSQQDEKIKSILNQLQLEKAN